MPNDIKDDVRSVAETLTSDTAAPEPTPEPVQVTEAPAELEVAPEPKESEGRARDESGRFAKKSSETPAPAAAASKPPPPGEAKADGPADPHVPTAPSATPDKPDDAPKAPPSWRPRGRESWNNIPQEAREEIWRREREQTTALQESAEARKQWGALEQVVAPLRAQGRDVSQFVAGMVRAENVIERGTLHEMTNFVAQLAEYARERFGPQAIEALDQRLAGGAQRAPAPQGPQQVYDPRFDEYLAMMQQNAQRQRETQLAEFAKSHEFYGDVADDMKAWVEFNRGRGREISLDDAYNHAIALHPEIAPVLEQRKAAKAAADAQASVAKAKAAASSPKPQPTTQMNGSTSNGSIRDDVRAVVASMRNR